METGEARLVVERVASGLSLADVARHLSDERALAVFAGCWGARGAVIASEPVELLVDDGDPFAALEVSVPVVDRTTGAVGGGWMGYLGYGVGRLVERLPPPPPSVTPLPGFVLGYYDHLLRFDADNSGWWFEALVTPARREALAERREHLVSLLSSDAAPVRPYRLDTVVASPGRAEHEAAIARTVGHIAAGDIFQANITMRLEADFDGSPLELFLAGLETLDPSYAAFVSGDWGAVASMSPELFVSVRERSVATSPIKGTAPRGADVTSDRVARRALELSEKDRAENVMIVDLMRNDLGRVCVPGSVRVDELCAVRPMSGVWHMVSTVTGELGQGVTDADVLRATFPPGSVTGAPKVRAMELISDLEPAARAAYTGALLLVSPVAGLTSSVAIRTFEFANGKAWVGVGSGIVADSTPAAEYRECLAKAEPLLAAVGAELGRGGVREGAAATPSPLVDRSRGVIETILTIDGQVVDPMPHLRRLAKSVATLFGPVSLPTRSVLDQAARSAPIGRGRLRISVCPEERPAVVVSCRPFERDVPGAGLSLHTCEAPGGLGPHKWRDRSWLDQRSRTGQHDVLLLVDGDDVLEASRSNLFVVLGSAVLTPPTDGRILPGLARGRVIALLEQAGFDVREQRVTLETMGRGSEVFLTNSLRGVEWVRTCEGVGGWGAGSVAARAKALFDEDRTSHLAPAGDDIAHNDFVHNDVAHSDVGALEHDVAARAGVPSL